MVSQKTEKAGPLTNSPSELPFDGTFNDLYTSHQAHSLDTNNGLNFCLLSTSSLELRGFHFCLS